jgi:hypothetical protein
MNGKVTDEYIGQGGDLMEKTKRRQRVADALFSGCLFEAARFGTTFWQPKELEKNSARFSSGHTRGCGTLP